MTNRSRSRRTVATLLVAVAGCGMLGGCIVMVVPAATSGLIARSAARRGNGADAGAASAAKGATPAAAGQPAAPGGNPAPSAASGAAATNRKTAETAALVIPGAETSPAGTSAGSTWYDVIRFEAKTALGTPDEQRLDVLRLPRDTASAACGSRPTAVLIDAATIGTGDYSYVGSLRTMGYAILLTTRAATLPAGLVGALAKEGIPAPKTGDTLFPKSAGSDPGMRTHVASRYCVVGLVGGEAGDFPGSALPGTHDARPGWFLIAKH